MESESEPRAARSTHALRLLLAALVLLALVVSVGLVAYQIQPWKDPANVTRVMQRMGALAPLIYVALISIAVIISPIPDTVPVILGGAGLGTVEATVFAMGGIMIGAIVSFELARRYGKRLLARYVEVRLIQRIDRHGRGFAEGRRRV